MTRYFDFDGYEVDAEWMRDTFGKVTVKGSSDTYHVSELRAISGPASIVVTVQSADGSPRVGIPVMFSWPDGEVLGYTDGGGAVGFGVGPGAWYKPAEVQGPHWVTVGGEVKEGRIEGGLVVDGLGMLFATNHDHPNMTYRAGDPAPEPPDPPAPDPNWDRLFAYLQNIIVLLEAGACP